MKPHEILAEKLLPLLKSAIGEKPFSELMLIAMQCYADQETTSLREELKQKQKEIETLKNTYTELCNKISQTP